MKTFQYIEPQFVPPVDLQTLNTAYSNLESMHQEAVKSSSELKNAIAQLQLNESEEGFRQQLVKSVEDTIDSNMNHGNLAGAYDDIIKLSGDIVASPALIGRLKAQQDYLTYQAKVDSMNLPDDYKEYFKEMNPYHYEDTYDRNGNVIEGSKWNPIKTPTTMVNLADIADKALRRVAEEVGQSSVTRWLDKDMKPTTDPTKAFDGEVYDITTNSWQRLGADKIADAIYAVIEQTPGAKESLDQDYDVSLWKHNKFAKTSDEITVSDITDENGNILSRENYLAKRINDTARTSAYEKRVTNTTYGSGLSTYIKAKHTPTTATSGAGLDNQVFDILDAALRDDPITFTHNKGEKAYELKANTVYQIKDTLSRFGISPETDSIDDLSYAIDLIPDTIDGNSTYGIKDMLNNQLMLLEEAQFNLDAIRMNMSDSDREKYDFALGMLNGGKPIKDRSRYDNRVINTENHLFNDASRLEISFKTDTELNDFLRMFANETDLYQAGINIGEKSITIDNEARNIIPLVASKATNYNRINTGWLGKMFANKPTFDIKMINEKGEDVTQIGTTKDGIPDNISKRYFTDLGDYYNKAQRFAAKYDDKYDITNKDITLSNLDIYGETHTEGYTSTMYNMGLMDLQEKKRIDTNALETIDNALLHFDVTQYDVYDANGKITDAKELQELKHELRIALQQNRVAKTSSLVPGIIDAHSGLQGGYTITILPPDNKKNMNGSDPKETRQYYIPGLGQEPHLQALNQNPTFNASNTLDVLNETLSTKYLTTDRKTPALGSITLTGVGNKNYICDFNGYKFPLNKEDATNLYVTIGNYYTIKSYIKTRNLDVSGFLQSNERTRKSLNSIVETLSNITGYNGELIADCLYTDIQN